MNRRFAKRAKEASASEIRELLKISGAPGWISFAGGYPDPKLFPKEKIAEIIREIILNEGEKALQYGATEGFVQLRETILEMERKNGVRDISIENIIITTGSQQGIDLLSKIFIEPQDTIILEAPSYLGALQSFRFHQCKFESVPLDENGLNTEILEEKLKKLKKKGDTPKFIYTVPTFHNPAGVSLSLERRKELIEIAKEFQIPIVEDDPYSKLSYTRKKLPSLLQLGGVEYVIKLGTFSKIIAGGLRLGWMVADKETIEKAVLVKQSTDLCSSSLTQYLANEFIKRGLINEYVKRAAKEYKEKRDIMIEELEKYCQKIEFQKPEGGLFLWGFVPRENTDELFKKAIEKKVAFVPGSSFYPYREDHSHLRLNFSLPSKEEIKEGIKRISEILK